MDDVTDNAEQMVTAVAGDVAVEDSAKAPNNGSDATAAATADAKLNGQAAVEETASSLDREEVAAVTAAQVRPLRPGVQSGLRLGMPG